MNALALALALAFEVYLPVLVELFFVDGDASIQNWIELVPVGPAKIERDELVELVYLVCLVCLVGRTGKPTGRTGETRDTR